MGGGSSAPASRDTKESEGGLHRDEEQIILTGHLREDPLDWGPVDPVEQCCSQRSRGGEGQEFQAIGFGAISHTNPLPRLPTDACLGAALGSD